MQNLDSLHAAVLNGDARTAKAVTQEALAEGVEPLKLVQDYMMPAMAEVGRRFESNEYFVPELLISARAMKAALELIRPLLIASGSEPVGRVALGTVKGDLHDIGKNLVGMMLEGSGFKVVDAGINVEPEKFLELARANNAQLIGVSALLTTTMTNMKAVVEQVKQSDLAGKVKVMIGGAPLTQAFCDEIHADGYSPDAASAADLAKKLVV